MINSIFYTEKDNSSVNIPVKALSNLNDDETWTGSPTVAFDTAKVVPGFNGRSLKFITENGATDSYTLTIDGPTDAEDGMIVDGVMEHWLWISDLSQIDDIEIRLFPDKAVSSVQYFASWPVLNDVKRYGGIDGQWFKVITQTHTTATNATWDYENGQRIKTFEIRVTANAASTVEMWYGGTIIEDFPKAAICIGFDGVYRTAIDNAIDLMVARGLEGVCYPVGFYTHGAGTSTAGRANVSELLEYQEKGWDIIPHGWETAYTVATTEAEMIADILHVKAWATKCGFHGGVDIGSPIGHQGICDQADARDIAAQYYIAARMQWRQDAVYGTSNSGYPVDSPMDAWVRNDYMQIQNIGIHDNTLADNKTSIDTLVALKGFKHMFTHEVKDNPTASDTSIEDFVALLDYIQDYVAAGTLEVITLTEYLRRTMIRSQSYSSGVDGAVYVRKANGVDQQLY